MQDDGIDPLDAFMAVEVNPEVKAKEAEEAKRRAEELKLRAQQRAVSTGGPMSCLGLTTCVNQLMPTVCLSHRRASCQSWTRSWRTAMKRRRSRMRRLKCLSTRSSL